MLDSKERTKSLQELVEERGGMPFEEASQWLKEQGDGNPNGTLGNLLRWGRLHKSDDGTMLLSGKGPEKTSTTTRVTNGEPPAPVDLASLEEPAEQMEAIARQLAIPPKTARAIATYVTRSFDFDDPEQVWNALKEVTEIGPSQRKRLWRTWTSWRGVEPPEELVQRVERENVQEAKGVARGDGAQPTRRFVAVNGEVLPADPDDPGGMAFSQALQAAQLQIQGRTQGDGGLPAALVKEMGENSRHTLDLMTRDRGSGGGAEAQLSRELMDSRIENVRTEFSGTLELMKLSMENQARDLSGAISDLSRSLKDQKPAKSWVDEMFEAVPGLKDRFKSLFEPPAPSTDSGVRITLPEAKDSEGNPIGVDLDSYERLENLRLKRDALAFARQQMPGFFRTAQRMTRSWDRMVEQGQLGAGGKAEDTAETDCPECGLRLTYKKGAEAFQCPRCKAIQTPDGRVISRGGGKGAEEKPEPAEKEASE